MQVKDLQQTRKFYEILESIKIIKEYGDEAKLRAEIQVCAEDIRAEERACCPSLKR